MIEVEGLTKNYGTNQALKEVSFRVEKGKILGFLGPNGAGKTTTMRILSGYLPATAGKATIAGYEVHSHPMAVRKNIGYLPENPPLYPEMTVKDFLLFVAKIKGVTKKQRPSQVQKALECCQIEDKASVIIRKLSKGYRQRVGIAQAIVHDPPVIILDEPTVGLDPRQIIEVRRLIRSLAGERTVILSSHILPEVSMTCDTITIINQGKIVATDTPEKLLQHLQGDCHYEIELVGEIKPFLPQLDQIKDIQSYEVKPLINQENRQLLTIQLTNNDDSAKDIARLLVNEGLDIYEMKRLKPSLEDVFLQLTTNE